MQEPEGTHAQVGEDGGDAAQEEESGETSRAAEDSGVLPDFVVRSTMQVRYGDLIAPEQEAHELEGEAQGWAARAPVQGVKAPATAPGAWALTLSAP